MMISSAETSQRVPTQAGLLLVSASQRSKDSSQDLDAPQAQNSSGRRKESGAATTPGLKSALRDPRSASNEQKNGQDEESIPTRRDTAQFGVQRFSSQPERRISKKSIIRSIKVGGDSEESASQVKRVVRFEQ